MDNIEIVEYNSDWPKLFIEEANRIKAALGLKEIVAIEHVGSTAIPNMAAKPIIDISIVVIAFKEARTQFVTPLERLGYVFWAKNPNHNEMFFVNGMPPYGTGRTHHIRVSEENRDMANKRLFRDWLIANPQDAKRYEALKKELASKHQTDREAYTDAKDNFVNEILSKIQISL